MSSFLSKYLENPRKLFLVDGFGAIVSAFFLGIVLVQFEAFFGIPKSALYVLAFMPCLFFLYDLYSYKILDEKRISSFLKGIAYLNLAYVILSIGMAIYHASSITIFGWIYIVNEILILLVLVKIEWNAAKRIEYS